MGLLNKIKVLARSPQMQAAYGRWAFSQAILRREPKVMLGSSAHLVSWANFSEYWTFRDGVPRPERSVMANALASCRTPVAFDIGANVGAFTCLLPELGARQVHAFEPIPETFCRLKTNVMTNGLLGCCCLNCLAVGRENDLLTFCEQARAPAMNRLFVSGAAPLPSSANLQTIAAVRLDDYCRKVGVTQIDFMKIDVEGMEPFVLEGATSLFQEKRVGVALIEICPANLYSVGLSPDVLHDAIIQTGYTPYALLEDGRTGQRLTLDHVRATRLANAVLLPG